MTAEQIREAMERGISGHVRDSDAATLRALLESGFLEAAMDACKAISDPEVAAPMLWLWTRPVQESYRRLTEKP